MRAKEVTVAIIQGVVHNASLEKYGHARSRWPWVLVSLFDRWPGLLTSGNPPNSVLMSSNHLIALPPVASVVAPRVASPPTPLRGRSP